MDILEQFSDTFYPDLYCGCVEASEKACYEQNILELWGDQVCLHSVNICQHTVSFCQQHTVSICQHTVSICQHTLCMCQHTVSMCQYTVSICQNTVMLSTHCQHHVSILSAYCQLLLTTHYISMC